jgi:hypothetical protein
MSEALRVAVSWAALILVSIHLGLALAAAGIPAVTALVGFRAQKRLRIFTDKFGQQAATFALMGGLWALVVLAALVGATWYLVPNFSGPMGNGWATIPWLAVLVPLLAGMIVFLAYRGLWHQLKTRKVLHVGLGLAATLLFWLAYDGGLVVLRPLATPVLPATWLDGLLPPGPALLWRLLALGVLLSLHLAGTYCAAWLLWRRNRDDFGRDYYNYTMRLTARLGFWAGLASVAALVWVVLGLVPAVGEITSRMTTGLGLYGLGMLVCLCGCAFVAAQENALRHKFVLGLATAGSIVALAGVLAALANVFWPGL